MRGSSKEGMEKGRCGEGRMMADLIKNEYNV